MVWGVSTLEKGVRRLGFLEVNGKQIGSAVAHCLILMKINRVSAMVPKP